MEQTKRIEYKVGEDIMKIIQESIYSYYRDVTFPGPEPKREITIKTGIAGISQIDRVVKEMAIKSGLVISASETGTGTKEDNNTTTIKYTIPFLATTVFTLQPEIDKLDPDTEYIYVNGYKQESYGYIIKDGDTVIAEIVCIGKLPVFKEELLNLVRDSRIAEKYEMYPTKVVKYIINALKNLE